ncbi:MAG: hypothetical protein V2A79_11600 [Planctomycetota bacterium]
MNLQAVADAHICRRCEEARSKRRPQAKDLPTPIVLDAIWTAGIHRAVLFGSTAPVSRWEIGKALGGVYPEKVVLAKLRRLVAQGVLDGCGCGCRGDFFIIERTP